MSSARQWRQRRRAPRETQLLLLAGDADGNLGDQAIRRATLALLRESWPDCRVTIFTTAPDRWQAPGVRALRGSSTTLGRIVREAARSDVILVGGGGLFQDDDSLVKMPYWAALVFLCRALGRPVVGFSLGIGPLRSRSSRLAARLAFACMDAVSARDPGAVALARSLTSRPVELVPDPALLLEPAPPEHAAEALRAGGIPDDGRPLIGFAPRRWFPPGNRLLPHRVARRLGRPDPHQSEAGRKLTARLAALLDALAERRGARILFLPSYDSEDEGDARVARQIGAQMRNEWHLLELDDAALYAAVCGRLAFLVAGRMHPAILATCRGKPVFGVGYNPKFAGFFSLIGRPDSLIDVRSLVDGEAGDGLVERALATWDAGGVAVDRIEALRTRTRMFANDLPHHEAASCRRPLQPSGLR